MKKQVLAVGGGVDSTALALIDANRETAAEMFGITQTQLNALFPMCSAWVFCDTGAEKEATYANIAKPRELAKSRGIRFDVIRKADYSTTGNTENMTDWLLRLGIVPIMPGASHVCSLKFKAEVMQKWAGVNYPGASIMWHIGIEANEERRCKKFTEKSDGLNHYSHPLHRMMLNRADCERIIAAFGWDVVAKSSCTFCPFMKADEIEDLYYNDPAGFALAEQVELKFKETSPKRYQTWLEAGQPLTKNGRAPRGMWRKDSYAEGARLYQCSLNGKKASVPEWRAHFEARDRAA